MSSGVIKVKNWEEFKRLAVKLKPNAVVYNIEQSGLSPTRELTCLRTIIPCQETYYVFLDFPQGEKLRETGIPLHKDNKGNRHIEDEDVINFLKTQLKRDYLTVCSYWTI